MEALGGGSTRSPLRVHGMDMNPNRSSGGAQRWKTAGIAAQRSAGDRDLQHEVLTEKGRGRCPMDDTTRNVPGDRNDVIIAASPLPGTI